MAWVLSLQVRQDGVLQVCEGVSLVWTGCLLLLCEVLGLWLRVTSFRVLTKVGRLFKSRVEWWAR